MTRAFALLATLSACNLDLASKTACISVSDCDSKAGEVCADNRCLKTTTCESHFDCDPQTICQDGDCQGFVSRSFAATLQAMAATYCNSQLVACGPAQMQKAYGSSYAENCAQTFLAALGQTLGPGPATTDALDEKMAAACVYDIGQGVTGAIASSFTNLPLSCNRMVAGTLAENSGCYDQQANCALGLECAFGPTLLAGQLQDFVCIKAFGQAGDVCAGSDGTIFTDCDVGLYCDWGRTWQCQARLAHGVACPAPFTCTGPNDPLCQLTVNPCVVGDTCSGTCVTASPICPLGPN